MRDPPPPSSAQISSASSKKPAWPMLEYASRRLAFVCGSAERLPNTTVTSAIIASRLVQPPKLLRLGEPTIVGNAVASTRYSKIKPAVFDAVEINAVIGVGAPWYTSGDQLWNGTTATL